MALIALHAGIAAVQHHQRLLQMVARFPESARGEVAHAGADPADGRGALVAVARALIDHAPGD